MVSSKESTVLARSNLIAQLTAHMHVGRAKHVSGPDNNGLMCILMNQECVLIWGRPKTG